LSARLGVLDESSLLEGVEGLEEPTDNDDDDDEPSSSLSTNCCFMSVASLIIIIMSALCGPRRGQKRTRDHRTLPIRER
jgi:hypothetical protein